MSARHSHHQLHINLNDANNNNGAINNQPGPNSPVSRRKFKPTAFPGSKPMHIELTAPLLSSEARPSEQNYRGFFHLGVIILIVSHFRIVVENLLKYGHILGLSIWLGSMVMWAMFAAPRALAYLAWSVGC